MTSPRTPDRRASAREVRHRVRELSMQTQAYVVHAARVAGLHHADVHATGITMAARDQGCAVTAGELGQALALSPAAVSAMLDRMQRAGHAERHRSSHDARRVEVTSTPSAEATSHALFDSLVEAYDARLAGYSDEELALVARVLRDLQAATAEATPRAPGTSMLPSTPLDALDEHEPRPR